VQKFSGYLIKLRKLINEALEANLSGDNVEKQVLTAMRYSLFIGGKRLRPLLCLVGAKAVGGQIEDVISYACALEMIHSYSLIHDDLPIMDNDDYRRGVPSNHNIFGESIAMLAGDGLFTQAMILMTDRKKIKKLNYRRILMATQMVMDSIGWKGMIGGQSADLLAEKHKVNLDEVQLIHAKKTGAFIAASVASGGLLAGGNKEQVYTLNRYGQYIGLAFQIADDLLNISGDPELLGKSIGSDNVKGKITYPLLIGLTKARQVGENLIVKAVKLTEKFTSAAWLLKDLALYIMQRAY